MSPSVCEVERPREYAERSADPFLRCQVGHDDRVFVYDDATVVWRVTMRGGEPAPGPVLTCLGPSQDLAPLLGEVADRLPRRPYRVSLDSEAADALPPAWPLERSWGWAWLWTTREPGSEPRHEVVEVTDHGEIEQLLAVANPDTTRRPDQPDIDTWLGVRDGADGLVAVGALDRRRAGSGHLSGIGVAPAVRRTGVGTSLSVALTRRALALPGHIATLGAYSSNTAALSMYRRLGYTIAHSFVSGPLRRA